MAKNHIIVGLDVGSSTIKSLVVCSRQEDRKLEVLSQVSQPSFGIRKGAVVDIDKVSEIIASVIKKSEKECGQEIEDVFVNIGGMHLFSTVSHGTVAVSRADQKISEEDIDRVIQAAQTFSLPPNREILDVFPREFIVDGEKGIRQPLGMGGVRLEVKILALCYFAPYFKNLTKAVLDAGLQPHITADPLASAAAVLTLREKELGVLLLDIGAGTTSFCVYNEGVLLAVGVVPIGSFNITKDIATGLETDIDTAEKIKLQFGACFLRGPERLKVKENISGESLTFSRSRLGKIIDARVLEIFQQVQKQLKKNSCPKLPGGAVLCGAGVNLPKIKDFSKKTLSLTSRIGAPIAFFPKQDDPGLACVCGLAVSAKAALEEEMSFGHGIFEKFKKILKSFIP